MKYSIACYAQFVKTAYVITHGDFFSFQITMRTFTAFPDDDDYLSSKEDNPQQVEGKVV